jgi:hypothetical protein
LPNVPAGTFFHLADSQILIADDKANLYLYLLRHPEVPAFSPAGRGIPYITPRFGPSSGSAVSQCSDRNIDNSLSFVIIETWMIQYLLGNPSFLPLFENNLGLM